MTMWQKFFLTILGFIWCLTSVASPGAEQLKTAIANVCRQPDPVIALGTALGGVIELRNTPLSAPKGTLAIRHRLLLPNGNRIRLDLHRKDKVLRQIVIEVSQRIPRQRNKVESNNHQPKWWLVADGDCRIVAARKLNYGAEGNAISVDALKPNLTERQLRLQLDPEIPRLEQLTKVESPILVAMVDSGVNYLLPGINQHLARDSAGEILGYDYWDMDPRPFDSNPARSAFVPHRHGTRTTSVVLSEAPMARIVPYRYPRPAMQRMKDLIEDAAAKGIVIMNMSLGSNNPDEWHEFTLAARAHPHMLFIASAGNNGRNIDDQPVYPAALDLKNLITVSSSDVSGLPARGTNWGPENVDLLIPAEGLIALDYSGFPRHVSGSSHAAARLSALATCLLAAKPEWRAAELKKAIFALAEPPVNSNVAYVRIGHLPAPSSLNRGACQAEPDSIQRLGRMELTPRAVQPRKLPAQGLRHKIEPFTMVLTRDAGWHLDDVHTAVSGAAQILAQCGVAFGSVAVEHIDVPQRLRYYDTRKALELMAAVQPAAPSAWFVRDTLMENAYQAETIGHANSRNRRPLTGSLWLTRHLQQTGLALAHEIYHLLTDSGRHSTISGNLMNASISKDNTQLEDWQCQRLLKVGTALGYLKAN